jgi:glycosyltransferase involved in cell wall biosynthesis
LGNATLALEQSLRVLILHNVIAPYRLPVFEALSQEWDLTVYFCQAKTMDRQWQVSLEGYAFRHTVLRHRAVRIRNAATVVLNLGLPARLASQQHDVYIAGENSQNLVSTLSVLAAAKLRKKPFICWSEHIEGEREFATSGSLGHFLIETYRRMVYRSAKSFVAYGTRATAFLVQRGVPPERIVTGVQVVPRGQTPTVEVSKDEMGFGGKKVILSVGYLVARKGLDLLIKAFRGIGRGDAVLVIAGWGDQEAYLRHLAGGASNICFPGYVDGELKARYYAVADVFVMPTFHDPWGLVVNEAMAYGLPIIVTDRAGCAPDLVSDNGYVVPAGDVDALQEAIERLLDDDCLRREMGRRSLETIRQYDVAYAQEIFSKAICLALEPH